MAAPSRTGTPLDQSGTSSITLSWPLNHKAGQYGLLCVELSKSLGIVGPSGWTLVAYDEASVDTKLVVYGKFAASNSEPTVSVTTTGGSEHIVGFIATFNGVNTDTPVEAVGTAHSSSSVSSVSLPALTSPGAERGLVYVCGAAGSSPTLTVTAPPGKALSQFKSASASSGTTGALAIAGPASCGAGSTGSGSYNRSPSGSICAAAILLNPVPPPPVADAAGSTTISLASAAAGTLAGAAALAGTLALAISADGQVAGQAGLSGGDTIQLSAAAALDGAGELVGSTAFTVSGEATGAEVPGVGGYGSIGLTAAGDLQGLGELAGVADSVFTWAASLSGEVLAGGSASLGFTATGECSGQAWAIGSASLELAAAAVPYGQGALAAEVAASFAVAPAELLGTGTAQLEAGASFALTGSGHAIRIVDPVIQEHWRVPSTRKVLLLTIGAPALPEVTPIVPVVSTGEIEDYVAPALAGPSGLTAVAMLDGAHLAWSYAGPEGATYVVELADDVDGSPSGWAIAGSTADLQYTLGGLTTGTVWVRVYASLNGRNSDPAPPVSVTPIPSYQVTGNTAAIASLQDDVSTINGVLTAQATDLVNLDARADALESEVGGLQTQTAALASADEMLDARVTATEGNITAQSSQLTSLSSSLEINRSVAGRTPLVFRQASAPTTSGTRYNLLLQTAGMASSPWARTATVAASTVGDPEGYLQAFRVTPSGDGQYLRQDVGGLGSIAARTFSFPVWIRADTAHTCSIRLVAGTAGTAEVLDVAATNQWQRVAITHVFAGETDTAIRIEIYPKQFGSTGQPNHAIDVFGPQLNEGAVRPFQRVSVANDFDGNGIPPLSTWYDTDDGNKEYGWQLSGGTMQWVLGADARIAATAEATSALDTRVTAAESSISTQASQINSITVALPGKASVSAVEALDVRIDATEAGVATYFASYTLTLDVNGKISGFKSVNDGSVATFSVLADVFEIAKPGGGDALTWSGGVLTALKGSYSVKLGAGFGSGSDLVLWYGADGDTSTRTVANAKIAITKDGLRKLGSTQVNLGSGWSSGASISYSAAAGTPATATISVTSGVFRFGDQQISYSASSASVSGTGGTSQTYWLYYDDPGMTGGAKTLNASTTVVDTFNSDTRVLLGSVTVAFPASGSSSGGGSGGSDCVDIDSVLPDGRRVRDLQPGDLVECVDVRTGVRGLFPLLAIGFGWADCYLVKTLHGEVIQSDTTPMDMPDGSIVRTHELAGHPVLQREHGFEVAGIERVGPRRVCKPDLGDRMFFAGTSADRCIATHNIRYKEPI